MADSLPYTAEWWLNELGEEALVFPFLSRRLRQARVSEERAQAIRSAVAEACRNALEHGNGPNAGRSAKLSMRIDDEAIVFRVYDRAPHWTLDFERSRRGTDLALIARLTDGLVRGREGDWCYTQLTFLRNE